ncbi:MAG TPA: hypothetical protein VJ865_13665 [Gemmatimonadaceae bacterium]|nr:hypothetical protein [Gemmatimonadaceae bacterium]
MKSIPAKLIAIVALAGLVAEVPIAQTSTSTPPPASHLSPLAFLAGSCWKGTFAGRNVTDEHCFTWIYNGRFLRDHHIVVGDSVPYEGETTYAWDAAQKQIVYWYIALPGFHSRGTVAPNENALVFDDNLRTNQARKLRTTWRRSGADSYTVRVEDVTGGNAKEMWSMEMKRSRPAP